MATAKKYGMARLVEKKTVEQPEAEAEPKKTPRTVVAKYRMKKGY